MKRTHYRSLLQNTVALVVVVLALESCALGGDVTAPRYALVYGVSKYNTAYSEGASSVKNLTYPDNDAISMAAIFESEGYDSVLLRYTGDGDGSATSGADPTKAQLLEDISDLSSISSDATVVIYFSGHGTYDDTTEYFVPYEGITYSGMSYSVDLDNCVSPVDLSDALATLPTKNVIVILDTCYSGGFVDTGSATDTVSQDYTNGESEGSTVATAIGNFGDLLVANAEESNATPPIVISAAGSEEESIELSSYGHGVFTYFLLASASSGDSNDDGYVSTTEAYSYSKSKVLSNFDTDSYYSGYEFLPRISGGARDLVLFSTD